MGEIKTFYEIDITKRREDNYEKVDKRKRSMQFQVEKGKMVNVKIITIL